MTTQTQQIRRRTNGTIDIDHYRNHALMERRETIRNTANGVKILAWPLVAAAALIVAMLVMTPPAPETKGTATKGAAITLALETR